MEFHHKEDEEDEVYGAKYPRMVRAVSFGEYEAALPLNNAIDRLVTDRQPEGALATALREAGTETIVAQR